MSPDVAERTSPEVRNLLALVMIQLSLSPRVRVIVIIKKKNGDLRLLRLRSYSEVTIKHTYPIPRLDESLAL